jgi:hypothetical protein
MIVQVTHSSTPERLFAKVPRWDASSSLLPLTTGNQYCQEKKKKKEKGRFENLTGIKFKENFCVSVNFLTYQ